MEHEDRHIENRQDAVSSHRPKQTYWGGGLLVVWRQPLSAVVRPRFVES
jgi:hypothetical protein